MRLKWLTPRVNLLLSVLSLIVGLAGTLALNKWWVVVLTVPAVILFLLSFERVRNIACRHNCWLNPGRAEDIFATALNPEQSPPCAHLTVEHSTGVAVATLAARSMLTSVIYLRRMLLLLEEEIQKEAVFSFETLDTHTNKLLRIQAMTAGIVSGGNFTTQCYLLIPNSSHIVEKLDDIAKYLQDNVLREIRDFRDSVPADIKRDVEVAGWKERVRNMLIERTCPVITENVRKLENLADAAHEILDSLVKDWHDDLRFVWEDDLCKPIAAEEPPEARIRIKDVADSAAGG